MSGLGRRKACGNLGVSFGGLKMTKDHFGEAKIRIGRNWLLVNKISRVYINETDIITFISDPSCWCYDASSSKIKILCLSPPTPPSKMTPGANLFIK